MRPLLLRAEQYRQATGAEISWGIKVWSRVSLHHIRCGSLTHPPFAVRGWCRGRGEAQVSHGILAQKMKDRQRDWGREGDSRR